MKYRIRPFTKDSDLWVLESRHWWFFWAIRWSGPKADIERRLKVYLCEDAQ
jgi:hypothetical protein